jgi:nucleoside-diphosphate-sugar epimerase
MGDGSQLTSTTHVDNAVHGLWLASHRGADKGVWFVKDEGDLPVKELMTAMLATQGLKAKGGVPLWLARLVARLGVTAWSVLPLPGRPMLTPTAVGLMGVEVTVRDDRARRDLGYVPVVTREEGLARLSTDN